jgi:outer membrane protein OmpA-like peptidoglycan-associated protein
MEHRVVRSKTRLIVLAAVVAQLGACSSVPNAVNPVAWYRGITGASKNDDLGKGQNEENLKEGSNEPFPNLGTVPDAPETALSTIDRDKLVNSLIADRNNAKYANDDLRAGRAAPGAPPPPPPEPAPKSAAGPAGPASSNAKAAPVPKQAASSGDKLAKAQPPARGSEAPPAESSLQSPKIDNPPKGDTVTPAPLPPRIPPARTASTKAPPEPPSSAPTPQTDTVMAAPPPPNIPPPQHAASSGGEKTASAAPAAASDARRAVMHHVADVSFPSGSALLSDKVGDTIDAIVKQHAKDGGKIRIVGHGEAAGANAAVAGFNLALNRAQAVAVALSDKGVPSKDIAVEAAPVAASGGQDAPRAEVFFEN